MSKLNRLPFWSLALTAAALCAQPLFADDSRSASDRGVDDQLSQSDGTGGMNTNRDTEMAGRVYSPDSGSNKQSSDVWEQLGKTDGSGDIQSEKQMAGTVSHRKHDAQFEQQKADLAPHSVMVETALLSALTQVKGLRTELNANPTDVPSNTFVQHFKMFGKEINTDLKNAKVHVDELNGSVKKYPEIAESSDYKQIDSSFKDLSSLNNDWQSKIASNSYWKDREAVKRDLDRFESRLKEAASNAKSFNTSQLDISYIG